MTGSSPRTWGTPRIVGHDIDARRFIPAHVGNAYQCNGATVDAPVHPHARGERIGRTRGLTPAGGSSPRTWGTHWPHARPHACRRFIPTHVGNAAAIASAAALRYGSSPRTWGTRQTAPASSSCATVHPHARGERLASDPRNWVIIGSSPRTWGTHCAVRSRL